MNTPPQILGLPQRGKGTQIAKGLVRQDIRVGLMLAALSVGDRDLARPTQAVASGTLASFS